MSNKKISKKQLVIEEEVKVEEVKKVVEEKVSKVYTAVSLFSGLGGDSLGMTQAGCKVIGYNELKPTFCISL